MTKMKLYTEEQVKQIQQAILCNHKDAIMDDNYCLNVTKPIELPSDEEIETQCGYEEDVYHRTIYKAGIKFVLNKIQGGNK